MSENPQSVLNRVSDRLKFLAPKPPDPMIAIDEARARAEEVTKRHESGMAKEEEVIMANAKVRNLEIGSNKSKTGSAGLKKETTNLIEEAPATTEIKESGANTEKQSVAVELSYADTPEVEFILNIIRERTFIEPFKNELTKAPGPEGFIDLKTSGFADRLYSDTRKIPQEERERVAQSLIEISGQGNNGDRLNFGEFTDLLKRITGYVEPPKEEPVKRETEDVAVAQQAKGLASEPISQSDGQITDEKAGENPPVQVKVAEQAVTDDDSQVADQGSPVAVDSPPDIKKEEEANPPGVRTERKRKGIWPAFLKRHSGQPSIEKPSDQNGTLQEANDLIVKGDAESLKDAAARTKGILDPSQRASVLCRIIESQRKIGVDDSEVRDNLDRAFAAANEIKDKGQRNVILERLTTIQGDLDFLIRLSLAGKESGSGFPAPSEGSHFESMAFTPLEPSLGNRPKSIADRIAGIKRKLSRK